MAATEIINSLNLSGTDVKTFREMFLENAYDKAEEGLYDLADYSNLLSMPLDIELFEHADEISYHSEFFKQGGDIRNDVTLEWFIVNCHQAGISLRWA